MPRGNLGNTGGDSKISPLAKIAQSYMGETCSRCKGEGHYDIGADDEVIGMTCPDCGGTGRKLAEDARLVQGTPEQMAVWAALLQTDLHVIVEAVAGSGKTFTITQYAMREKKARIGLVAFNKHIATELTNRMGGQPNVECMTYHSLGYRAVRNSTRTRINVDQYKVLNILDGFNLPCKKDQEKTAKYRISSLVSFAKTYGKGPDVTKDELEEIADRHDVDLNGLSELVFNYVPVILSKCMTELATVDFDDMVWLPYVLELPVPKFDVLCVDEYQDTGLTQQWLAIQGGKRLCAVGDPRQAIYQFRGADSKGFDRLRAQLGDKVVTLPLTLTRRCPKAHVALAQTIVPQIKAMDDAPEGLVRYVSQEAGLGEMKPGDLVVCRVNAPLIGNAYKLIKQGKKAVVRGRDIGQGIGKLLDNAAREAGSDATLTQVLQTAGEITGEAIRKFRAMPHGKGEMRAMSAEDKYSCLFEMGVNAKTVAELKAAIENLFADFESDGTPKNAIVLGTVHRTKGLEGNRVYILSPELIPHPMAKGEAGQEAEKNLAYVAVTRAKFEGEKQGELIFVGGECSLFPEVDDCESMRDAWEAEVRKEGDAFLQETPAMESEWDLSSAVTTTGRKPSKPNPSKPNPQQIPVKATHATRKAKPAPKPAPKAIKPTVESAPCLVCGESTDEGLCRNPECMIGGDNA